MQEQVQQKVVTMHCTSLSPPSSWSTSPIDLRWNDDHQEVFVSPLILASIKGEDRDAGNSGFIGMGGANVEGEVHVSSYSAVGMLGITDISPFPQLGEGVSEEEEIVKGVEREDEKKDIQYEEEETAREGRIKAVYGSSVFGVTRPILDNTRAKEDANEDEEQKSLLTKEEKQEEREEGEGGDGEEKEEKSNPPSFLAQEHAEEYFAEGDIDHKSEYQSDATNKNKQGREDNKTKVKWGKHEIEQQAQTFATNTLLSGVYM